MDLFFNIRIEFDHTEVERIIQEHITEGKKGYVCVVEGNIVSVTYTDEAYRGIINAAIVNICDGSYVALFYNMLKKKSAKPYIGGDLFLKLIHKKKYRHMFVGATQQILDALKGRLQRIDDEISAQHFMPLPFLPVDDFDYPRIAREINAVNPDLIWVSLGAPKQEMFMNRLLPHLCKGVMVGIGAVFSFQSGIKALRRAPDVILKMRLEWLFRLIQEPNKQWKKNQSFLKALPLLLIAEIRKA